MKSSSISAVIALSLIAAPTTVLAKPARINSIQIPAPAAGKAQVVWFRPSGAGPIVGCSVKENNQKISSLGDNRYFIMLAEPGTHTYTVSSEATDTLIMGLRANETVFARCTIGMGFFIGHPHIEVSDEATFRKVRNPKMVDAEDMGPAEGALRPEQVAAALQNSPPPQTITEPAAPQ